MIKIKAFDWEWYGKEGKDELDGLLVLSFAAGKQEIRMPSFKSAQAFCNALKAEIKHQRYDELHGVDQRIRDELDRMVRE